jgi:hypothetical protein
MPLIQLPVYSRYTFKLTDPSGGPPQQALVVVSLADQWLRWPEATDPAVCSTGDPATDGGAVGQGHDACGGRAPITQFRPPPPCPRTRLG